MFPVGLNDLASPVLITRGSLCVPQFVIPGEFFMKLSLVCLSLAATLILVGSLLSPASFAQSLTSGSVTGTVTDPSGAAVPNATVTLKNNDTGAAQNTTTNSTGAYRFALLNPGSYGISVKATGFQ